MSRILVVDDDEMIRLLLRRILEKAGHEVCDAQNGRAAMQIYSEHKPDCVITDLIMPEQEGIETIQQMRQHLHAAPIIATSGQSSLMAAHYLKIARALGADAILEKPFSIEQILELVTRLLAKDPATSA